MVAAQPLYDLVLLLDSQAEDDRRAQILRGVEEAIGKDGEVVNKQDWGLRSLAFEIRHKKDADYHLLQFHGTPELLRQVDRTLHITDEVVRFRIIKLAPGTPPPPEHRPEPRPAGTAPDEVPATVGAPAAEESASEEAAPFDAAPVEAPAAEAPVAEAPAVEEEAAAPADAAEPAAEPAPAADESAEEPSDAPSA